jgi:hypothetical protein
VVNRGHISKYNSYYQFIMKAEGMKNHGVRIMHAQQTLSPVSYTRGFSMENLQLDLKHLVAMNSLSSSMISSLVRFIINLRCSTFSPVIEPGLNSICNFPCQSSCSKPSPCAFVGYTAHRIHLGHTMATSQSTRKGTQSSRTARSEAPKDWDSFSPAGRHSQRRVRNYSLPTEKTRSNRGKSEAEGFIQEGNNKSPLSPTTNASEEGQAEKEQGDHGSSNFRRTVHVRLIAEELLRRAIRLEPAGGSSHEDRSRTRKEDITGENEEEPSQQLKQAKLAIAELYQENMELRRQLATKTTEASANRVTKGTWHG